MPTFVPAPAAQQRAHIATVMQVAERGQASPAAARHDALIRDSWQRCVHEHRLDPTRMQDAVILPAARLREHQDQMDSFLAIARHGLEALYQQVAGQGYVVLLTDARGVTVDFIGDLSLEPHLRRAGLYLGADWSEHHAGTCGVGTCIRTAQALTVHLDDHFDATHIPLTCTAAPVFDTGGHLQAVLDISQLSSGLPKESQHLALQLVKVYAQHVENAAFLQRHRADWVLRLSRAPQFLAVNPDYLLALDDAGRVVGHNRPAQRLFEPDLPTVAASAGRPSVLVGQRLEALLALDLAELARLAADAGAPWGGTATRAAAAPPTVWRHGATGAPRQRLYLQVSAPARPRPGPGQPLSTARPVAPMAPPVPDTVAARVPLGPPGTELPPALAALSAGDAAFEQQLARAARLAQSSLSLLITGETGSGKEWLARALHQASPWRAAPFVAVNCAAIPDTLIESELFGHLPGSFSGAGSRGKKGLIQAADGGTLFLDEIGDMPLALQARLLRVLAEQEVLPVGATQPVPVRLRVMAATHCALPERVRAGLFREDLYYRLCGAQLELPPLRQRQDLDGLIDRMLAPAAAALSGHPTGHPTDLPGDDPGASGATETPSFRAPQLTLHPQARAALHAHAWPGNLRELRHALDQARCLCESGQITLADLPAAVAQGPGRSGLAAATPGICAAPSLPAAIGPTGRSAAGPGWPPRVHSGQPLAAQAEALSHALAACGGNVSAAARQLGCSRMTLYRRMKRLGLS